MKIIEEGEDAKRYEVLAQHILEEIRKEYFTPSGRCAVPTQTGLLLAIRHGLSVDSGRMEEELADMIRKNGRKLQIGFVETPLLCPMLTKCGHGDMAFDLLLNEEYPGWLYAVKLGATTVWERWNSVGPDGVIADNGMNSLNHYAYGSIVEWMYRDVAGIDAEKSGFRRARLNPHLHAALGMTEAEYRSAAGIWNVRWEILKNGDVSYRCTIPFDCTAVLSLPYGGGEYELEAGEFEKVYTPDRPLRAVFTTYMPLEKLLQNPKVKTVLSKIIPQIAQLPPNMQQLSMRELAKRMGSAMSDEMFEQIDGMLAKL